MDYTSKKDNSLTRPIKKHKSKTVRALGICSGGLDSILSALVLKDQGIEDYNQMGEYFKEFTLHDFFQKGGDLPPEKIEMFFMACYNLDTFRRFLMESSFFDKFEVDDDTIDKIRNDDIELMKFGFRWLRFAFFGEKTLTVKKAVAESKEKELRNKGKIKDSN